MHPVLKKQNASIKKEKFKFWLQSKIFVSSIIITFSSVKQNPTVNDYLQTRSIGLASCNMDKEQIKMTSPSKNANNFCTALSGRVTFFNQGQGHGMYLNRFPDTSP